MGQSKLSHFHLCLILFNYLITLAIGLYLMSLTFIYSVKSGTLNYYNSYMYIYALHQKLEKEERITIEREA